MQTWSANLLAHQSLCRRFKSDWGHEEVGIEETRNPDTADFAKNL